MNESKLIEDMKENVNNINTLTFILPVGKLPIASGNGIITIDEENRVVLNVAFGSASKVVMVSEPIELSGSLTFTIIRDGEYISLYFQGEKLELTYSGIMHSTDENVDFNVMDFLVTNIYENMQNFKSLKAFDVLFDENLIAANDLYMIMEDQTIPDNIDTHMMYPFFKKVEQSLHTNEDMRLEFRKALNSYNHNELQHFKDEADRLGIDTEKLMDGGKLRRRDLEPKDVQDEKIRKAQEKRDRKRAKKAKG